MALACTSSEGDSGRLSGTIPGSVDSGQAEAEDGGATEVLGYCAAVDTLLTGLSHEGDIQPIWNQQCASCHTTSSNGGLRLSSAYDAVVGVPADDLPSMNLVEPGDPGTSYLWLKLTNEHLTAGGDGDFMPRGGKQLEVEQCQLIVSWISEGAPP